MCTRIHLILSFTLKAQGKADGTSGVGEGRAVVMTREGEREKKEGWRGEKKERLTKRAAQIA